MVDVASAHSENANFQKLRKKILQWEIKNGALAALTVRQEDVLEQLSQLIENPETKHQTLVMKPTSNDAITLNIASESFIEIEKSRSLNEKTYDFEMLYNNVCDEIQLHSEEIKAKYLKYLIHQKHQCDQCMQKVDKVLKRLSKLSIEYEFVSHKTCSLNFGSEQLAQERRKLNEYCTEVSRRLSYFTQIVPICQRLENTTLSVASEEFKDCLDKIDDCIQFFSENRKFKESNTYTAKYRQCLSKAVNSIRIYMTNIITQATQQVTSYENTTNLIEKSGSDLAFALYYGKYQSYATKMHRVSSMVEERIGRSPEYKSLLADIHNVYFVERASIMSKAVDQALKELICLNKSDHCSLFRSACSFLVHICQDEYRLFNQFFTFSSEQLNTYIDGLCTILYDILRPYIIHVNHLETLAEICSILRIEMMEEHVQQNPESLEAFGQTIYQLLQDVQERLVFRAHLYLESDILNYQPSSGDLSYPEKLQMMENIALSLQGSMLYRSESKISVVSSVPSCEKNSSESNDITMRQRAINSPADLHGMWYPTVRRTLVCLSRLYRCVDRPIFQGLSQEALKYCIQSVSNASARISLDKSLIDGELFEIKHLLILREQIAPFRVDFTIKETSLDFSKVKSAAFALLQKRKQIFSLGSNNALLEFLLDGTPQVKEHFLDSRKDVDRQLKIVCEKFIQDAVNLMIGPLVKFFEKAQKLIADSSFAYSESDISKIKCALRQSPSASPQVIGGIIQESQRLIKSKLKELQRSMQLYLSNKDTEFIIFRPIRNNIISTFVKLEQLLSTNGYSKDDLVIANCPTAEQISILLSTSSLMSEMTTRKISSSSTESVKKIAAEKKVSFEGIIPSKFDEKEENVDLVTLT